MTNYYITLTIISHSLVLEEDVVYILEIPPVPVMSASVETC